MPADIAPNPAESTVVDTVAASRADLASTYEKMLVEHSADDAFDELDEQPEPEAKPEKAPEPKAEKPAEKPVETKAEAPKPDTWVDDYNVRLGQKHGLSKEDIAAFPSERVFRRAIDSLAEKVKPAEKPAEKQEPKTDPLVAAYQKKIDEALDQIDESSHPALKALLAAQQELFEQRLAGLKQGDKAEQAWTEFTSTADSFFDKEDPETFGKGTIDDQPEGSDAHRARIAVAERALVLLNAGAAESHEDALRQARYAIYGPKLVQAASEKAAAAQAKQVEETTARTRGRRLASPAGRVPPANSAEDPNIEFRDTPELHAKFNEMLAEQRRA
jgi:hypothetical protein